MNPKGAKSSDSSDKANCRLEIFELVVNPEGACYVIPTALNMRVVQSERLCSSKAGQNAGAFDIVVGVSESLECLLEVSACFNPGVKVRCMLGRPVSTYEARTSCHCPCGRLASDT